MTAVASSEDPHSLLSRLSLADSTSPSGANSPVPTTPEANVAHLARIQARRVAKIARAETALWKPITLAEAGRDVDPEQALKGKEVRLTPDGRARIVKRAGRNVYLTDGTAWQVQLDGFHHKTDEEEYEDPLTAASPYALQTSSLWDALFDARPSIADGDERAVVIREATYGLRTENGESTVGLGIKWARKPAKEGGKDEGGWAWIWGELDGFDDDDEDDEMEEGDEDAEGKDGAADKAVSVEKEAPEERKRFKGVHLAQLVEDDDDNNEAEADKAGDEAAADA